MSKREYEVSDITNPVDPKTVPDDYVQDGEAETPVSEEIDHQRSLDQAIDDRDRARLAASVLRDAADSIETRAVLTITPAIGGSVLGVVVAMMQASGWKKEAGALCFETVWGDFEEDGNETN